ncbi:hypothetical protein PS2_018540 [Malus domestica]
MKSAIELFCKNWSAEPSSIGLREEKLKTLKGMSFEGLENLRVLWRRGPGVVGRRLRATLKQSSRARHWRR